MRSTPSIPPTTKVDESFRRCCKEYTTLGLTRLSHTDLIVLKGMTLQQKFWENDIKQKNCELGLYLVYPLSKNVKINVQIFRENYLTNVRGKNCNFKRSSKKKKKKKKKKEEEEEERRQN
jgi:hypothetical protein